MLTASPSGDMELARMKNLAEGKFHLSNLLFSTATVHLDICAILVGENIPVLLEAPLRCFPFFGLVGFHC